jgi:DNA-binding FadR family transcriptional regulator
LFKRAGSFSRFRAEYDRQVFQHTEHINIANALFHRDAEAAKDYMMAHLDRVIDLFRNLDQPLDS